MSVQVTCGSCGKQLQAKPELAGKRIKCPQCGKPIDVPAAAPPTDAKIAVKCQCGAQYQVAANMAGKQVKCSKCGKAIPVSAGSAARAPAKAAAASAAAAPAASIMDLIEESGPPPTMPNMLQPGQMLCPNCNGVMQPGSIICVSCGFDARSGKVTEADIERQLTAREKVALAAKAAQPRPLGNFITGIVYSVLAASAGVGVWLVVHWLGVEMGIMVWVIGLLAGWGMNTGSKGFGWIVGVTAATIAVIGIAVGEVSVAAVHDKTLRDVMDGFGGHWVWLEVAFFLFALVSAYKFAATREM